VYAATGGLPMPTCKGVSLWTAITGQTVEPTVQF